MSPTNLSAAIPVAIEKAKAHFATSGHRGIAVGGDKCPWSITAGEMALAEAFWEHLQEEARGMNPNEEEAFRTFVEKCGIDYE